MTPAEYVARLRAVGARVADMRPVMQVVGAEVREYIDARFEQSNDPDGAQWPDLSEATLAGRARRARGFTTNRMIGPLPEGESRRTARRWSRSVSRKVSAAVFGAKPLLDTGRLRRSITSRATRTGLSFGTNVVYAPPQNFGNPASKFGGHAAPIPARRFLPITADGRDLAPISFWDRQRQSITDYILTGALPDGAPPPGSP